MAIKILQGLDYKGTQPNFVRDLVATKAELFAASNLKNYPNIHEVFCLEDGCKYRLDKTRHESDPVTGKWRKVSDAWTPTPSPSGEGVSLWYGTNEEFTPEEEASLSADTLIFVEFSSLGVIKILYKTTEGTDQITELYTKSKIDTIVESIGDSCPIEEELQNISQTDMDNLFEEDDDTTP